MDSGDGSVTSTTQFKQILENCDPVLVIRNEECIEDDDDDDDDDDDVAVEHGFSLLKHVNKNLLSFNNQNIYILDPVNTGVIAWWNIHPHHVKDVHVVDDDVVVLTDEGSILFFTLGPLTSMISTVYQTLGSKRSEIFLRNNLSELELSKLFLDNLEEEVSDVLNNILQLKTWRRSSIMSQETNNLNNQKESVTSQSDPELAFEINDAQYVMKEDDIENIDNESEIDTKDDVVDAAVSTIKINKTEVLNDLILRGKNILEAAEDSVCREVSKFAVNLRTLLLHHLETEDDDAPVLVNLSSEQKNILRQSFNKIFSNQLSFELCFHPLKDIIEEKGKVEKSISYATKQLVMMFEQQLLDQDYFLSSVMNYFIDLFDVNQIVKYLGVHHFFTLQTILDNETKHKPQLTPLSLDQIDETNVYDSVNLLSNYSTLSILHVLRYAVHVSQVNTDL